MATAFGSSAPATHSDQRFMLKLAIAMAAIMVAGFSMQLAMGRSSFTAPLRVHAHALIFFGWIVLFLNQARLAAKGDFSQHRQMGRIAALWMVMMVVAGFIVTLILAREGRVPFFFYPQQFVIADPVSLLAFVGLTLAALRLRNQPDWHMRLQICALAAISGPGFGRLLPMPLIAPYGFEVAALCGLAFPVAGMIRDKRNSGTVHPAWLRGSAVLVAMIAVFDLIAYSPVGDALYQMAVANSPGADVPGLALPPPPPM